MMGEIASTQNFQDELEHWETQNRTSLQITLTESPGILNKALNILTSNKINMTRIQSKPSQFFHDSWREVDFFIDVDVDQSEVNYNIAIDQLKLIANNVQEVGTPEVPWFPTRIEDFDFIGKRTLGEGEGIQESDHPSFRDPVYKKRRDYITQVAFDYKINDAEIPSIKYTDTEKQVWNYCYTKLKPLIKANACTETNQTLIEMEKNIPGFNENDIPQLEAISSFLTEKTGWRLKPVGGLLTQREFLNGLAFKVFHSTQYIRHHSNPEYTPEPDIVHELVGHASMFAHKDFADFSQTIGLASLGASEIEIKRLGAIYWFTIEFGMCLQDGKHKAYGAGILSSFGEIKYCLTDVPKLLPLDPYKIA